MKYRWPKMNEGVLIRYNFLFKTQLLNFFNNTEYKWGILLV